MEVDLSAVGLPAECDRGGLPVTDERVSLFLYEVDGGCEPVIVDHKIEIAVLPGLATEKRIHAPPSVDPAPDAGAVEAVEQTNDFLGGHPPRMPVRHDRALRVEGLGAVAGFLRRQTRSYRFTVAGPGAARVRRRLTLATPIWHHSAAVGVDIESRHGRVVDLVQAS